MDPSEYDNECLYAHLCFIFLVSQSSAIWDQREKQVATTWVLPLPGSPPSLRLVPKQQFWSQHPPAVSRHRTHCQGMPESELAACHSLCASVSEVRQTDKLIAITLGFTHSHAISCQCGLFSTDRSGVTTSHYTSYHIIYLYLKWTNCTAVA